MNTQRTIVIIPSERDRADPDYFEQYFKNFLWHVQHAASLQDCRIVVAAELAPDAPAAPRAPKGAEPGR